MPMENPNNTNFFGYDSSSLFCQLKDCSYFYFYSNNLTLF